MKLFKNNIILFSCVSLIAIILIIAYAIWNNNSNTYNNVKIDKSKQLVYTIEEKQSSNYMQYTPYLNIKGENSTLINNNIIEYINSFTNNNTGITYEYDINGKILSLILKVEDHSYVQSAAILYFRSYNINLKTSEILSKDKILNYFNITNEDAQLTLNSQLGIYYNNLVNNNSINPNECDYNCFLKSRKFTSNNDDVEYYIKNGKLIAYKPYTFISSETNEKIIYGFEIN